ncbi:MAG TPA: hypothetical protein VFA10_12300 [Ktedonobacteraceae bacterium]|nr:hypothetical protein [Ktedonobacteraceae bacterium]
MSNIPASQRVGVIFLRGATAVGGRSSIHHARLAASPSVEELGTRA